MSKKEYYAVRKGRVPGIYKTWEECKKQVHGYLGAEYKGFDDEDAVKQYMSETPQTQDKQNKETPFPCTESDNQNTATAYVDGSYDKTTRRYAYGCIILHDKKEHIFSNACENPGVASMRNVAGEITGALVAMKWCIKNHIKHLNLYYDYEGIEKWCTGVWKANNPHTQKYKKLYDEYTTENNLTVTFHKVKAHSGDSNNEKADKLARAALGK